MRAPFVHLHNHSAYSFHDGIARIDDLIAEAARLRFSALALTDHGNMHGAAAFFSKALAAGIKPILGCEIYVRASGPPEPSSDESEPFYLYHLPLLVRNDRGYRNLCRLISLSSLLPETTVRFVTEDSLSDHAEGLIALSGCLRGYLPRLLLADRVEEAKHLAEAHARIFGKGNFFIELQDHGKGEERRYLPRLIEIARGLDLPMVVTNDSHFARASDFQLQELIIAIGQGRTLQQVRLPSDSERRFHLPDNHYTRLYNLRPAEEMAGLFPDFPQAARATLEIAERCNFQLDGMTAARPRFPVPSGSTEESMLVELARAGLDARGRHDEAHRARLESELDAITARRLAGHFLMLWDIAQYARRRHIPYAAGRGIGGSSLVGYSLGISDVDPIDCRLAFDPDAERGPRLAIEVSHEGRQELIDRVFEVYGDEHVAHALEFTVYQPRAALRECGKALGADHDRVEALADALPPDTSIREAFTSLLELDESLRPVLRAAMAVDSLPHHISVHGTLVVSSTPLPDVLPASRGADGRLATHFPPHDLDRFGFLRIEFPGNRALGVLSMLGCEVPQDTDDPAVYELLGRRETTGVWPLDTPLYRSFEWAPDDFEGLIVLKALGRIASRNGPHAARLERALLDRLQAPERFPELAPILSSTGGMIVFQEQLDEILQRFTDGSFPRGVIASEASEASGVVTGEALDRFKRASRRRGLARRAGALLDLIWDAAPLVVSKASVAAAAVQTYRLAWLKAHFPLPFVCALLNSHDGDETEIEMIFNECERLSIDLHPPDINVSDALCLPSENAIQLGLNMVRGLGEHAIRELLRARAEKGPFATFCDFLFAVDHRIIHRRIHEALVRGGCFLRMGLAAEPLMAALDQFLELKHSRERMEGQSQLFDTEETEAVQLEERVRRQSRLTG